MEFLVGASTRKGCETVITVWRRQVGDAISLSLFLNPLMLIYLVLEVDPLDIDNHVERKDSPGVTRSDSLIRNFLVAMAAYLICSALHPLLAEYAHLGMQRLPSQLRGPAPFGQHSYPATPPQHDPPIPVKESGAQETILKARVIPRQSKDLITLD